MLDLTRKIKDDVGEIAVSQKEIGIEIEVEAANALPGIDRVLPEWVKTLDGSLRGAESAEFVLAQPMNRTEAFAALDTLTKHMEDRKTQLVDTVRAGVHIHLNVINATWKQLFNTATLWYIFEEALTTRFCGEGRSGNHFCLRAIDADILTYEIGRVLGGASVMNLSRDHIRYAALNYTSIFRHGSLEFRPLRTPTDFERIKVWIDLILKLKEAGKLFVNPQEIVAQFSMGGELNFAQQVFGNMVEHLGPQDVELEDMLMRGARIAQEIAYARKEW